MFGYYAYYEEVKEQIMSFINYFSDAVKERDEALKESKEALKEKDEALKESEEALKEKDEALKEKDEALYKTLKRIPDRTDEEQKQLEELEKKLGKKSGA